MATRARFELGMIWGLLLPLTLVLSGFVPGASAQTRPATAPPVTQLPLAATPPAMQPPMAATPAAVPPPSGAMPPATPDAAPLPGTDPTAAPVVDSGWGLCQCVGDSNKLDFSCPGSVQACQSACGTQYSFKPDAICRADASH
jgi:hypothetical protein